MDRLLGCPFCGTAPEISAFDEIYCGNDKCSIRGILFRDAKDWNTRADISNKDSNAHVHEYQDIGGGIRSCKKCFQVEQTQNSVTIPDDMVHPTFEGQLRTKTSDD